MRFIHFVIALIVAAVASLTSFINDRADRTADRIIHSVSYFRRRNLHNQDTGVTLEQINQIETEFENAMRLNENNTSLVDAIKFYVAILRLYNKHLKTISAVEEALNIHQLFRHMFAV